MRKEKNRLRCGELLYTIEEMFWHKYGDSIKFTKNPIKYIFYNWIYRWKKRIYISGIRDYISQERAFYKKWRDNK